MTKDKQMKGIGGAPTRATTLPTTSQGRKECPVASGVLDYFPDAVAAIARVSYLANEQHNAGQPLHWARAKSTDEADALMRHFLQRGLLDEDGLPHSAKMAWRALALLQKEIEGSVVYWACTTVPITQPRPIADGPYCVKCGYLAEIRSDRTQDHYCIQCADREADRFPKTHFYSCGEFTVMEPVGGTKRDRGNQ